MINLFKFRVLTGTSQEQVYIPHLSWFITSSISRCISLLSLNLTQRLGHESTSAEKENAATEGHLKAPLFLVFGHLLSQRKTQKGVPWHLP